MMADRPDIQHTLLRIAACTSAEQLTATLAQGSVDRAQLVETAADTIPASALLALAQAQPLSDPSQWPSACVLRALSIDATTGRIDLAITWLEHCASTCTPSLNRLLAYARLVQAMDAPAGALAELAPLEPPQAVGWSAGRLHDSLGHMDARRWAAVGRGMQDDEVRAAWDAWWAGALDGDAWQHAVFRRMLQADAGVFAPEVRVAAALLGVCAGPEEVDWAVQGIEGDTRDARRVPGDVLAAAVARDTGRLVRSVRRHPGDSAGAVRALSEAWHVLHGLSVATTMPHLLSLLLDHEASH
ncbi:hypothetical protein GGI15_004606, partial [Coemansia interrupta]